MNELRLDMTRTDRGYSIYDRLFERADMLRTVERLSAIARTKAGARHVLEVPAVRELANDQRLLDIASRFVGPSPPVFRATLFEKSRSANWLVVWHQDTALPLLRRVDAPEWGPWSTKAGVVYAHAPAWALERVIALRVNLDDSTMSNGPLRVLPNTHQCGVLDDEQIKRLVTDSAAVDCLTPSGGVVAMRPLTVHSSSKSTSNQPRRVLHIEYAASLDFGSGLELTVG